MGEESAPLARNERTTRDAAKAPACGRRISSEKGAVPRMADSDDRVDPMRLTVEQAAKLLSAASRKQLPAEQIEADMTSGAPRNRDGTINLVHYAAWLVQEMGRGS